MAVPCRCRTASCRWCPICGFRERSVRRATLPPTYPSAAKMSPLGATSTAGAPRRCGGHVAVHDRDKYLNLLTCGGVAVGSQQKAACCAPSPSDRRRFGRRDDARERNQRADIPVSNSRRHGPPIAKQAPHRHRQAKSGTCRGREPPHARHTFEVLPPETRTIGDAGIRRRV